jgi:hypothetical protein
VLVGVGGCGGRCIPMKITKHSNPSWRDEFRRSLLDMHLRKNVVVVGGVVVGFDCVIHPCYLFFDLQIFFTDDTFSQFRTNMDNEKKTRERNEEAMLQILENMSDTSSADM